MAARTKKPAEPKQGGGQWIPARCTAADLSALFGVSSRTVRELAYDGKIVKSEGGRSYETLPSIHGYIEHLRAAAAGRSTEGTSLADERVLTERLRQQVLEMDLAERRGTTFTEAEISGAWGRFAGAVKQRMLGLPGKIGAMFGHLTAADNEKIRVLVRDELRDLAEEVEISVATGDPDALKAKK